MPAPLLAGLARLEAMPPPPLTRPAVWGEVVRDALALEREGWAAQALALGWDPLDLWGCWPFDGGDDARAGLAVWTAARRVMALDERLAIVCDGERRAGFARLAANAGERVFLWAIGEARARPRDGPSFR